MILYGSLICPPSIFFSPDPKKLPKMAPKVENVGLKMVILRVKGGSKKNFVKFSRHFMAFRRTNIFFKQNFLPPPPCPPCPSHPPRPVPSVLKIFPQKLQYFSYKKCNFFHVFFVCVSSNCLQSWNFSRGATYQIKFFWFGQFLPPKMVKNGYFWQKISFLAPPWPPKRVFWHPLYVYWWYQVQKTPSQAFKSNRLSKNTKIGHLCTPPNGPEPLKRVFGHPMYVY